MTSLAALSSWSAGHHGVVTIDQLHGLGLTHHDVAGLCRRGVLARVRRGVYVHLAVPTTMMQRVASACVASGGAASHTTAGKLWGFRRVPTDRLVHVSVDHGRSARAVRLPDVRIHRSLALPAGDIVRRRDLITLTSPPRTLFDLAWIVPAEDLESMIEQAIDREMTGIPTLWSVARRLRAPGRAGSTAFVDVLASRPSWRAPEDSHEEHVLAAALERAGLPTLSRQFPIRLPGRVLPVHLDLAWPDIRLAIEVDHVTWHGGRIDSTQDKWRDRQLRLLEWEVDRVTDEDVRVRLAATVADLTRLRELRSALLAR